MAKRKPQARVGDIFTIPLDDTRVGFGHVLLHRSSSYPLYVAIFRPAWPAHSPPRIEDVATSEVAFLGGTADALIWHERWTIVGNVVPDLKRFPWPHFLLGPPEQSELNDFDGRRVRHATPADQRFYDFRFTRAPIAYESALKALHGICPLPGDHHKLSYEYALSRAAQHPPV